MPDLPVLYSFRRCPFAMRARWALWVAGIAVEHREIVLRDKPAAMLAASPKGTVPVMVVHGDGGATQVIDESLDVMRWALAQHDPERWLQPEQGTLAEMLALIEACQARFKPHLDRSKYPQRYADEVRALAGHEQAAGSDGALAELSQAALATFVAVHRQQAREFLLALAARLQQSTEAATGAAPSAGSGQAAAANPASAANPAETADSANAATGMGTHGTPASPALFGTRPALADFAIAPFVRQFAQADAAHWQAGDWPAVRAWLAAMLARPEFEAQVMRKHALWVPAASPA